MGILHDLDNEQYIARCATPGCRQHAGHGLFLTMCEPHATNLARIREEFVAELKAVCPSTHNGGIKKVKRKPVCGTVGCYEPRKPGHAVCVVCESMEMAA